MNEPWRLPFPDSTTETIDRIDAELAKSEFLHNEFICYTCGNRGFHTHWRN